MYICVGLNLIFISLNVSFLGKWWFKIYLLERKFVWVLFEVINIVLFILILWIICCILDKFWFVVI